jgi:hypothetical protein
MAAKKRESSQETNGADSTVAGYWTRLFEEHRDWLAERSNDKPLAQWRDDHLGEEPDKRWMQGLQNTKSRLRKKYGIKRKKRRKGGAGEATAAAAAAPTLTRPTARSRSSLTALEEQIDDCLHTARELGDVSIGRVVDLLRQARNMVVVAASTK